MTKQDYIEALTAWWITKLKDVGNLNTFPMIYGRI